MKDCPGPHFLCTNEGDIFQDAVMIRDIVDVCPTQCPPQRRFSINVFSGNTPRQNSCKPQKGQWKLTCTTHAQLKILVFKLLFLLLISKMPSHKTTNRNRISFPVGRSFSCISYRVWANKSLHQLLCAKEHQHTGHFTSRLTLVSHMGKRAKVMKYIHYTLIPLDTNLEIFTQNSSFSKHQPPCANTVCP